MLPFILWFKAKYNRESLTSIFKDNIQGYSSIYMFKFNLT
jgi:hypothetical protein